MATYQRPMVTVDQNLTITPTSVEREQPAFIFGPNYQLHRYSAEAEKAATRIDKDWEGQAIDGIKYPGAVDATMVDNSYTKLIGDNVVAQLFDMGGATFPEAQVDSGDSDPSGIAIETINANGGYTKLLFADKVYIDYDEATHGPATRDEGCKRNVEVGDIVIVKYPDGDGFQNVRTKVVEAVYSSVPWNLDDDPYLEVAAGTLITVADPVPVSVEAVTDVSLCEILQGVEFPRKNLAAAAAGSSNPGYQWEESGTEQNPTIKVNSLSTLVYDWDPGVDGNDSYLPVYAPVLFADLYLTYRERIETYADAIHTVEYASQVASLLGTVDKDNPIALGVYMACLNAASDDGDEAPPVYFMATPYLGKEATEAEEYAKVLDRATINDKVYALAPTTRNDEVLELVRSHVLDMSAKTVKQWRIAVASAEIPDSVLKLGSAHYIHGNENYALPVSPTVGTDISTDPSVKYTMIRAVKGLNDPSPNGDTQFRTDVKKGDVVRFCYHKDGWGEEVYEEYIVDKVINNNTVKIVGEIDMTYIYENEGGTAYIPSKVEIYHVYSATELAEVVASVSKAWATRRMLNVFPTVFKNDSVQLTGEFAACAVAGRISSCEPQQPMTNLDIRGMDDIPLTYQTYSKAQLDIMAAGGTFIIAQDLPADKVYIRHQITTAYPDGNLNTAELSITKNLDSISYAFADVFAPYIGRYNITPRLLVSFESIASRLLQQLQTDDSVYGPQIIAEGTEILYIRQNELMKDHVDIAVRLNLPYPCNNIDIVLTV